MQQRQEQPRRDDEDVAEERSSEDDALLASGKCGAEDLPLNEPWVVLSSGQCRPTRRRLSFAAGPACSAEERDGAAGLEG